MNLFLILRLILPLLSAIILIFLLKTKHQRPDSKLAFKIGIPVVIVLWISSKLFFPPELYHPDDKDVTGKIIEVSDLIHTGFKVDDGSSHSMGMLYKGLAVTDSVHHWRNGDWEYFKKDSTGAYHEIIWILKDTSYSLYEWHFK